MKPWLNQIFETVIRPERETIASHPFVRSLQSGECERGSARVYFEGLYWHLLDFGKHAEFLMKKRPAEVNDFLRGRSEDEQGDTDILARTVRVFGGDPDKISASPWTQNLHPVWITHDSLLRAAIYSQDLPWQVGSAALNIGIESLVPSMIEPLFEACVKKYDLSLNDAEWLASRSGPVEKEHGENGFLLLNEFVKDDDLRLQEQCSFYIRALARSMSKGLLQSGLPR